MAATALAAVAAVAGAALLLTGGAFEDGFLNAMRRGAALALSVGLCGIGLVLATAGCFVRERRRRWAIAGALACVIVPVSTVAYVRAQPRPRELVAAASRGDVAEVRRLLARGISVESVRLNGFPIGGGDSALTAAVAAKRTDLVDLLLAAGANIERPDPSGDTPLLKAVRTHDPAIIAHVLDRGADVNARSPHGETPIAAAAGYGKLDVVALLLDRGADPFDPVRPALVDAALADRADVIRLLAARGYTPDRPNSGGAAALARARLGKRPNALAALVELGAGPASSATQPAAALPRQ
jgi:hypothetical protein